MISNKFEYRHQDFPDFDSMTISQYSDWCQYRSKKKLTWRRATVEQIMSMIDRESDQQLKDHLSLFPVMPQEIKNDKLDPMWWCPDIETRHFYDNQPTERLPRSYNEYKIKCILNGVKPLSEADYVTDRAATVAGWRKD